MNTCPYSGIALSVNGYILLMDCQVFIPFLIYNFTITIIKASALPNSMITAEHVTSIMLLCK